MREDTLLNRLREMILAGHLLPGERVTEAGLAERLGLSRTPIRSALPALAAEGLLETVGKRGFAVREFSESESLEALELRALLEGQAARNLAEHGASAALLVALDSCLADGDSLFQKRHLDEEDEQAYGEMNGRFHHLIVEAAGSPLLSMFVERLNLVPLVAPSVIVFDQVGLRRAFDLLFRAHGHHHAIVEAIRQGDGARAEGLFREHANQQRVSMFARRAAMAAP